MPQMCWRSGRNVVLYAVHREQKLLPEQNVDLGMGLDMIVLERGATMTPTCSHPSLTPPTSFRRQPYLRKLDSVAVDYRIQSSCQSYPHPYCCHH